MQHVNRWTASLLLTVLLLATVSVAQYQPMKLRVDAPFSFVAGSRNLPPGRYWISRVAPYTLELRNSDDRLITFLTAGTVQSLDRHNHAGVRFKVQDGVHVLSQVWQEGVNYGFEVRGDKRAVKLAQVPATDTQGTAKAVSSH